jgi:hypothetical protein
VSSRLGLVSQTAAMSRDLPQNAADIPIRWPSGGDFRMFQEFLHKFHFEAAG